MILLGCLLIAWLCRLYQALNGDADRQLVSMRGILSFVFLVGGNDPNFAHSVFRLLCLKAPLQIIHNKSISKSNYEHGNIENIPASHAVLAA